MEIGCSVKPGMFINELAVSFDTGYGEVKSIVPKGEIVNGKINLSIEEETDDDYIVFVPGEVTSGKSYVAIKKTLLEA